MIGETQLTLKLSLPDEATFENYIIGDNQNTVSTLQDTILSIVQSSQSAMQLIYLWGSQGVGRTHLLQAACRQLTKANLPSVYLPLQLEKDLKPAMLDGLETLPLICIDDLHVIAGNKSWEEALFHLYNRLLSTTGCLLVTATESAHHLPLCLPDLQSRLTSGITCQLHALSDDQKCDLLILRAKLRGMKLSNDVAQFLVRRLSRDTTALINVLDQLDQASLTAKHRLTLPFVKTVLTL